SSISGWSILRITILAARRVFPPDLMTPAKASKPRMKLNGPEAVPPPESCSCEPRIDERFVPVPDPHLKSIPSVLAKVRMESSESFTELIKQAEHCGLRYPVTLKRTFAFSGSQCQFCASELGSRRSQPTLNHTGELNAARWSRRMYTSSSWKFSASVRLAKYPLRSPQWVMVSATRLTSARAPLSRSGVPICPWRYLLATMLAAVIDQSLGTSTSFCSKMVRPCASVIDAVRSSHWNCS